VVPFDLTGTNQPPSLAAEPNRPVFTSRRRGAIAASIAIGGVAADCSRGSPYKGVQPTRQRSGEALAHAERWVHDRPQCPIGSQDQFFKAERNVELIDGQALFEVAKDKTRPFVVRSGATLVRAVGTQFDVYRKRSGTTVTVIEGRWRSGPGSLRNLRAGTLTRRLSCCPAGHAGLPVRGRAVT